MENDYVVPTSKEIPVGYGKDLVGKMITFGEGKDMSWGIEIDLKIDSGMRGYLVNNGIVIPDRIGDIIFLTLSPQESLIKEDRTIRSNNTLPSALQYITNTTSNFDTFTRQGERPFEYISREFHKVLPTVENKNNFNRIVGEFDGSRIVIVQGHGGGDPQTVGEQYGDVPTDKKGNILQKPGNDVLVATIIERYGNKDTSAILLDSCYVGEKEVVTSKSPVFYIRGESGILSSHNSKSEVALPKNQMTSI